MRKAKIIIEYRGRQYRCNTKTSCNSKRDCDLFEGGVCNSDMSVEYLPCDAICDEFIRVGGGCPKFCFKEVQ